MKATTPKLWLLKGVFRQSYGNLSAHIYVCIPGLLDTRLLDSTSAMPTIAKLRFSTTPAKGFRRIWFKASSVVLWWGTKSDLLLNISPGGLADWMDRNQLLPEVRGIDTPVFPLYVKLITVKK